MERAAWYVATRINGFQFLQYDDETKRRNLTSCPHDATLFTSMDTAGRFAEQLRIDLGGVIGDGTTGIFPTRTNAPNVLTGAYPRRNKVMK